ncbi:hypothetical protein WJX72_001143 [[Myrmecia] bisecta]|uniref:Histone deacetylase complex subunit SAP30 Sin3 binding domain-containing protein n=1 Tax=[Myrmecia] bisecta TaxID=41462 RepID=A0AAW1R562_9CHLO
MGRNGNVDVDWPHQGPHAQMKRSRPAKSRFPSRDADAYGAYAKFQTQPASRVDLSKLKVVSLRKYSKLYDLAGVTSSSSKEDLAAAVARHWNNTVVAEEQVLIGLAQTLKKLSEGGR